MRLTENIYSQVPCGDILTQGCRKEIERIEPSQARTTLGIDLAPDGNTIDQTKSMHGAAVKWADAMRTGKISKMEAWIALNSTIWSTLSYPLPALNLTKKQCEYIMSPILNYALPALGNCRNFPRTMVFAPTKYLGIGIKHLHTSQEIARLKDIMLHTYKDTTTGRLYRNTTELLMLEVGLGTVLSEISYSNYSCLATNSLIKSTWNFLQNNDLDLRHDIVIQPQRIHDQVLMQVFTKFTQSREDILLLNRCRLFLRAYHLSDIVDGSGVYITDDAWLGRPSNNLHRTKSWPSQGCPSNGAWILWRKMIKKCFLGRGMKLRNPLGLWLPVDSDWPWYYSTSDECLYHFDETGWRSFSKLISRGKNPIFSSIGKSTSKPSNICKATVFQKRDRRVCSGYGEILCNPQPIVNSLQDHLLSMAPNERWCVDTLELSDDGYIIADSIRNSVAIAVSDGSFKDTYGTAAWVLEGENSIGRIIGRVIAPGAESDQSAYRSELSGILAVMIMVKNLCLYHNITDGAVELACDGLSAIDKSFSYVSLLHIDEPNYDLITAIKHQWKYSPLLWRVRHVKGHQDEHTDLQNLDRWGKLNVEMDRLAKSFIGSAKMSPRDSP
jgi:hypothetical protein